MESPLLEDFIEEMMDQQDNPRVVADEVIGGIRRPGRYDATVASEGEAVRLA